MSTPTQKRLNDNLLAASTLLKSMSHPARLMVLCMLIESPGTTAGELSALIGLSPSATSQHLARMKEEHLIVSKRQAQQMKYFISDTSVHHIVMALKDIYCSETIA